MQQAQVIMLELHYPLGERVQVVYRCWPWMKRRACWWTADTRAACRCCSHAAEKGVSLAEVTHLILTHHDLDSAGCAGSWCRRTAHPGAGHAAAGAVFCGASAPRCAGSRCSRSTRTPSSPEALERVETLFEAVQPVAVSRLIKDGDTFDVAGGFAHRGDAGAHARARERVPAGVPGAGGGRRADGAKRRALALPDQALTLDREAAVQSVRALAALPLRAACATMAAP